MDMKVNPARSSVIDELSFPQLMSVKNNLHVAKFDLMKFTPAMCILNDALEAGVLKPDDRVIESSSGTFALALAIVCSLFGLKITLVTGPVSPIVRWRLESLGASLHVVDQSMNCQGGIQQARLRVLGELLKANPDSFWPQQYTNPLNADSYQPVARKVIEALPKIDIIVGAVGSGGSLFGIAKVLRQQNPDLKVVAVDHNRSVIFGAKARTITKMCRETFEQILAMGAGIPMGNVNFQMCDEVHWVPVPQMIQKVHQFHRETGLLVGPSSGAALTVAEWEAASNTRQNILTILPDHGVRYVDTVFNPAWLAGWKDDMERDWEKPAAISTPRDVSDGWCHLQWGHRCYKEVVGCEPFPQPEGYNP